jgi:hypothetical protein
MSFKIISTALLVIIASALLINLAFKVKLNSSSDTNQRFQATTKGCCGSSGGGCNSNK